MTDKVTIKKEMRKDLAGEFLQRDKESTDKDVYTISFSSTEPYLRWFGYEITDPNKMDLTRLNSRSQILFNHDWDNYVGVIEKAYVKNDKAYVDFRFGTSEKAIQVRKDVDDGILASVSFGYETTEMIKVGEKDGIAVINCATLPFEVSIVTVPADITVGFNKKEMEKEMAEMKPEGANVELEVKSEVKPEPEKEKKELEEEKAPVADKKVEAENAKEKEELEKLDIKLENQTEKKDNEINKNKIENEPIKMEKIYAECLKIAQTKNLQETFFKYFEIEGEKSVEGFKDFIIDAKTSAPAKVEADDKQNKSKVKGINIGYAIDAMTKNAGVVPQEVREAEAKFLAKSGFVKTDPSSMVFDIQSFLNKDITVANPQSAGLMAQEGYDNSFIANLTDDLVLQKLGVKFYNATGQGAINLPVDHAGTDLSDAYKLEKQKGKNFELNFSSVKVEPFFIQGIAVITKEMLARSSIDLNTYAVNAIRNAIYKAIEVNVLGLGAKPGLLNNALVPKVAMPTVDYKSLIALRGVPRANKGIINNNRTAFLTDYIVSDTMESTLKTQNEFLYDPSGTARVVGQSVFVSDLIDTVPEAGAVPAYDPLIFGDWSQLYVALWNGVEISLKYDFYENGDARLLASAQIGVAVVRPESFVIGKVAVAE